VIQQIQSLAEKWERESSHSIPRRSAAFFPTYRVLVGTGMP